jgi:ornithine cyclodeaminase/alanine dehydrogenase-like protein (mu-crystallin family)
VTAAQFLFLSQEDVVAAGGLDMVGTIEAVEEGLELIAVGDTILPPKTTIHWSDAIDTDETEGRIMAMPAYVGGAVRLAGF